MSADNPRIISFAFSFLLQQSLPCFFGRGRNLPALSPYFLRALTARRIVSSRRDCDNVTCLLYSLAREKTIVSTKKIRGAAFSSRRAAKKSAFLLFLPEMFFLRRNCVQVGPYITEARKQTTVFHEHDIIRYERFVAYKRFKRFGAHSFTIFYIPADLPRYARRPDKNVCSARCG